MSDDPAKAVSYRGICWHKKDKRWRVSISDSDHDFYLGNYREAETAARVYDVAALMLRGRLADLNFDGHPPKSVSLADIRRRLLRQGAENLYQLRTSQIRVS